MFWMTPEADQFVDEAVPKRLRSMLLHIPCQDTDPISLVNTM